MIMTDALKKLKQEAVSVVGEGDSKGTEYINIKLYNKTSLFLGRDAYLVAVGIAYALSEINKNNELKNPK